jgi:hypothetical protein
MNCNYKSRVRIRLHLPNTSGAQSTLVRFRAPSWQVPVGGTSADSLYDFEEATETVLREELRETVHDAMKMEKVLPAVPRGSRGSRTP